MRKATIKDVKAVIFDYGWTLSDPNDGGFFSDVKETLAYLSPKYMLAIVSKASGSTPSERIASLKSFGVYDYFSSILFHETDKDGIFQETLRKLKVDANETAVVGDEMKREIAWGNKNGALTIWLRKGDFINELPNKETGNPDFEIKELSDIIKIIK